MSNLTILGDTSGSVVLQAPAVAGSSTITLPTTGGTIRTTTTPGTILQVVSTTPNAAQVSTSSTSFVTSGLSLAITPTNSSNKILITCTYSVAVNNGRACALTMYRNSTNLAPNNGLGRAYTASGGDTWMQGCITYLDSPSTTSSTTYALYYRAEGSYSIDLFAGGFIAPTLTLMEVAA